jgi:hypothetical protein
MGLTLACNILGDLMEYELCLEITIKIGIKAEHTKGCNLNLVGSKLESNLCNVGARFEKMDDF